MGKIWAMYFIMFYYVCLYLTLNELAMFSMPLIQIIRVVDIIVVCTTLLLIYTLTS